MREVTYEDWQKNPIPRMMWVWDDDEKDKVQRRVIYFIEDKNAPYPVVVLFPSDNRALNYMHCAEIEKQRRMTNKELSWWLSEKPHRELKMGDYIYHDYDYKEREQDAEVTDLVLIRENSSGWREPTMEVEE